MNQFFNANHSPIGAYASFTLGFPGAKGGPGMEAQSPADTNVYIGMQRRGEGSYEALPFFDAGEDESKRYDVEKEEQAHNGFFDPIPLSQIKRSFHAGTDTFSAKDLTFTLYSRVIPVPEPGKDSDADIRHAIVPAVLAELTIDNRGNDSERMAFFGLDKVEKNYAIRHFTQEGLTGIGQGGKWAVFTDGAAATASGFVPACILGETQEENWRFNNGNTGMLLLKVPVDTVQTWRFAICFYRGDTVTYGIEAKYFYTRYFDRIEEVGRYALTHFEQMKQESLENDRYFQKQKLTGEQYFMLIHAIRSYYNSSELLIRDGKPVWVINEGEFRMMNTMDLTVDQVFFEAKMNPWTVRNELDFYLENYSYTDQVFFPGEEKRYEGGLTFCHDCGVANQFTRKGHSSYEKSGLTGCFSYMSQEQLVNWLCCLFVYLHATQDREWLAGKKEVIRACFASMQNRDHPREEKRNGVMGLDSSRTKGGAEITTYDSLDISLGQARNNIYLAGKCWAVYVMLERYFAECGENALAAQAKKQACRCADTLAGHLTEDGYIPAVIAEHNDSKIIPAVEGLVFPYVTGLREALAEDGEYGTYIRALKTHFKTVMQPGICLFEDGGWKLSSTSTNSWLSKIYLCEFVARRILGFDGERYTKDADRAHAAWLTHPEHSYWCWSDQIVSGVITASKFYPRGVTAILWLEEERTLTREEVKRVIEGKGAAWRVPMAYDHWIYSNLFRWDENARKEWLRQYPCDIDYFQMCLPDLVQAPADDPDYRWTGVDMELDEHSGIDNRVLIEDWESEEAEQFFATFPSAEYPGLIPAHESDGRYVLARFWYCFFERLWSVRGMENALTDFYLYPDEVHRLFQKLTDFYMRMMERACEKNHVDGFFVSDDLGTQQSTFFSLDIFREFFKPYYKQLFDKAHELNTHFWLHTCGNIELFLPDFIEIGLDVIHPIQKYTMEEKRIAELYGDKICIFAGFDVQRTIPFGTEEDVRKEVRYMVDAYWRENGRFLMTMGNGSTTDWKLECLAALYEETMAYSRKKAEMRIMA